MNIIKKSIVILIIFTLTIGISFTSRAENEVEENVPNVNNDIDINDDINANLEDILNRNGIPTKTNSVIEQTKDDGNYFGFSRNPITLDYDINGDVFVFCTKKVTIDAHILGNVFICANEVEITNKSEISSSLFCIAKKTKIAGGINLNTYCATGDFSLEEDSFIYKNLYLTAQNISLDGLIESNAMIAGDSIVFKDTCCIEGNLNYSAPNEIEIPETVVGGITNFSNNKANINKENVAKLKIKHIINNIISYVIFGIILYLVLNIIKSKIITNDLDFKSNILSYILLGLLGLFVTPFLIILLFIIPFFSQFAFVILGLYILLLIIASTNTIITLSKICADKLHDKIRINDILRTILFIILFGITYNLLKLIPHFGAIVTLIIGILGIGITIKNILPNKEQNQ